MQVPVGPWPGLELDRRIAQRLEAKAGPGRLWRHRNRPQIGVNRVADTRGCDVDPVGIAQGHDVTAAIGAIAAERDGEFVGFSDVVALPGQVGHAVVVAGRQITIGGKAGGL